MHRLRLRYSRRPLRFLLLLGISLSGCSPMCGAFWDASQMKPFGEVAPPPEPDYALESSWAALPARADPADVAPEGEAEAQAGAAADVFFIHPTTFFLGPAAWNGPLDREDINAETDRTLRGQASAFNGAGRVFAPRYRQASLHAQLKGDREGMIAAFDVAYGDLRRAFARFLELSGDRPIIIAGHSQGSVHALRLLEEHFAGKPLASRLVAAYLVGAYVAEDQLTRVVNGIPLCATPSQTGCLVTWNTLGPKADLGFIEGSLLYYPTGYEVAKGHPFVCVNPLAWTATAGNVPAERNLGSVLFAMDGAGPAPSLDLAVAGGECREGLLRIDPPSDPRYRDTVLGEDVYHLFDYALYYMNVRRNAEERVQAFVVPVR